MSIDRFRGEHFFLSNMYPLPVFISTSFGISVPTSEHYYMSERFKDPNNHIKVAYSRGKPDDERIYRVGLAAKSLAHSLIESGEAQVDDFEIAKLSIMKIAIYKKFNANPELASKLVETGDEMLSEGNTWGDRFWGVDPPGSNNGENNLGKILMQLRFELANN